MEDLTCLANAAVMNLLTYYFPSRGEFIITPPRNCNQRSAPQTCMGRGGEMERDEDHFEYGYDSSGNLQTITPNFLVHLVGDDPKTDAPKVVLKTNFETAIREFDFYLNESTSDVILAVQVELGPDGLHFTLRQRSTSEGPIEYIYPLKRERSFPLSQSLKQSHRFDSLTSHETLARVSIEHGRWSPLLPAASY